MARKPKNPKYAIYPFEHRGQKLVPANVFIRRLIIIALVDIALIMGWVFLGTLGYMTTASMKPVDAFLNASMIAGGMGPVEDMSFEQELEIREKFEKADNVTEKEKADRLKKFSRPAKIFAGIYSILSGMLILAIFGILAAPVMHRVLHRFHLEPVEGKGEQKSDEEKEPGED